MRKQIAVVQVEVPFGSRVEMIYAVKWQGHIYYVVSHTAMDEGMSSLVDLGGNSDFINNLITAVIPGSFGCSVYKQHLAGQFTDQAVRTIAQMLRNAGFKPIKYPSSGFHMTSITCQRIEVILEGDNRVTTRGEQLQERYLNW